MVALAGWLGVTLLKGTLVLATALLLGAALRHAPGQARHRLWSLAFVGLLALPIVAVLAPPVPVPALATALAAPGEILAAAATNPADPRAGDGGAASDDRVAEPNDAGAGADRESGHGATGHGIGSGAATGDGRSGGGAAHHATTPGIAARLLGSTGAAELRRRVPTLLLALWATGFTASLLLLGAGLWRCHALMRRARPLDHPAWQHDLEWHRNFFGIRRSVRLLESPAAQTPMTGGVWRPVVLVPTGAGAWSPVRRRVVLLHELVHIRRFDVVRHLAARLGVALYWFHPLAWLAGRSSAIAREQACDEEVVRLGIRPSVYASHLLELSVALDAGPPPAPALPMIQRSQLETRLMRILDTKARPRGAGISALAAAMMVLTAVAASIAAPYEPDGVGRVTAQPPVKESGMSPAATPAKVPTREHAGTAIPSAAAIQDTVCWQANAGVGGRFSGTMSIDDRDGTRIISGVGTSNGDRVIQRWVDDLRLCLRASGNVEFEDDGTRLARIDSGGLVVMEAQLGERVQSLVIRNDGAGEQLTWRIDGASRPVDAEVERWRAQMTDALAAYAQIVTLRGRRSSLRGEISSIRGQRSSLRGQISSIRGARSSLQGQISSIHGRRSSLRGEISALRGHVSSLRGQISAARGHVSSLEGQIARHDSAISGLQASRYGANAEELAVIDAAQRRHEEAIDDLQRQIEDYDLDARVAELERQIADFDVDERIAAIEARLVEEEESARIAEVEQEIAALDVEARVAEIEAQIEALDVEGRVARIEAEIEALEVDERVEQIEPRLEAALRELRATIERIGD